jgi:NAD(P)-dependent dehydrogenase (short-subunit alcohol dehydrogenase family)
MLSCDVSPPAEKNCPMSTAVPRLALVTGAGGGLGRAFCRQLAAAADPWHIVAADLDVDAANETLAEVRRSERSDRSTGEAVRLDVTDPAAWAALRDRLQRDWPRLDLLVNNAGICTCGETLGARADDWRRVMEVNYFGVLHGCQIMGSMLLCKTETPTLQPPGSSLQPYASRLQPAIINVASIVGAIAGPSMSAYCASKAAVIALSESLYAELRPVGVHVTIVAPGFFSTGLLDRGTFCTPRHREEAQRLSQNARFTADDVAREALAASARGELYAVVGRRARWLWRFKRLAPRLLQRIVTKRYHQTFGGE